MIYAKNIFKWLPYIYFFVIFLLINIPESNIYVFILTIPFLLQLFFHLKYLDEILGILTFILSVWLMLAYASDLHKITTPTDQSYKFIAIGGILVISNFVMCILLFRNALKRVDKLKEKNETVESNIV